MMRKIAALFLILVGASGCESVDTTTTGVPLASSSRQHESPMVIGTPVPLPFDNQFPNRWNPANNGTNFEPCVTYSDEELDAFGVDPSKLKDVAIVDGQGTRGCNWNMLNGFSLSQVVTNSESLDIYREGVSEVDWRPDLFIDSRRVGLFGIQYDGSELCSTYVQSARAGVVTNVMLFDGSDADAKDPCELVEAFTRAYINKIPE